MLPFGIENPPTASARGLDAQQAAVGDFQMGLGHAFLVGSLAANAGYDYASKFYPHPARLELLAEVPRELGDHPATSWLKALSVHWRSCDRQS